jgi:hypothetical protein
MDVLGFEIGRVRGSMIPQLVVGAKQRLLRTLNTWQKCTHLPLIYGPANQSRPSPAMFGAR